MIVDLLDKPQLRTELWKPLSLVWQGKLTPESAVEPLCKLCSRASGIEPKRIATIDFLQFAQQVADHDDNARSIAEKILDKLYPKPVSNEPQGTQPMADPKSVKPNGFKKCTSIAVLAFTLSGPMVNNHANPSGAATPLSSPALVLWYNFYTQLDTYRFRKLSSAPELFTSIFIIL